MVKNRISDLLDPPSDPSTFGGDWWMNASLNDSRDPWVIYAHGYLLGARVLVEHVEEARNRRNFLVYPIVFLYRQHIELSLKILIRGARKLLDRPEEAVTGHDLKALWEKAEALLREAFPDESTQEFNKVEGIILDLARDDPRSAAFRYPVTTKGDRSIPGRTHIHLSEFRDHMEVVVGFLGGSIDMVVESIRAENGM